MATTYPAPGGPPLWRLVSGIATAWTALDAEPWRRNDLQADRWNLSNTPLQGDLAVPRNHLQFNIAVRSHAPTRRAYSAGKVQMVARIETQFAFFAVHDAQWDSYMQSMQAASQVHDTIMGCAWHGGLGLSPVTVQCDEAYSPARLPGKSQNAGLIISQTYLITHTVQVRP